MSDLIRASLDQAFLALDPDIDPTVALTHATVAQALATLAGSVDPRRSVRAGGSRGAFEEWERDIAAFTVGPGLPDIEPEPVEVDTEPRTARAPGGRTARVRTSRVREP